MLLKDLISIPTDVGGHDFVLRLTEGITDEQADRTVDEYVVTPQTLPAFEQALGLIQNGLGLIVDGGRVTQGQHAAGVASFLHGSFGSGKSHFMAVLHLLLRGHRKAVEKPELAPVVAKFESWLGKKRLLLVACHMIGADTVEERVYRQYSAVVARSHPDVAAPPLFQSDELVEFAVDQRRRLGDQSFFAALNGDGTDEGWGEMSSSWNATSFDLAVRGGTGSLVRQQLAAAVVERLKVPMKAGRDAALPLGEGLVQITRHAKGLGYDGVVLFLDELILWLAGLSGDRQFLERETNKLVTLVESQAGARPIPVVSFIARQRTLRELVEARWAGADQVTIDNNLAHHEGRFTTIELSTAGLPEIAQRRLLRPKDEAAKAALKREFDRVVASGGSALQELQGPTASRSDFQRVYPFSPTLVDTLVHAASLLQRDRTALRAMLQLLVRNRDHLDVGSLIPVGDLYDVIANGNDAVHHAVTARFGQARSLYDNRLLPMLEQEHGISRDEVVQLPWSDAKRKKWRDDDRLLKTLLLGALVPGVPSLQQLTAGRIAALNHGTIVTPLPGTEGAAVLSKLRKWSASVPEIRIAGGDANPTITLELSAVDVEPIIRQHGDRDTLAARVRTLRELLRNELGLADAGAENEIELQHEWRGVRRGAKLIFGNIGNMSAGGLRHGEAEWRLWIDMPVDERTVTEAAEADDRVIADARQSGTVQRVMLWRPHFLNDGARQELGRYVIIDAVLRSSELTKSALQHLSQEDQATAKKLLEGNRQTLLGQLTQYVRAAYGLASDAGARSALDLDVDTGSVFVSLDPAFTPRPPAGGTLRQGLENLLEQAWMFEFPAAPNWPKRITKADLERVLELCRKAAAANPPRVAADNAQLTLLRQFADPLNLGKTDSAFVLDDFWRKQFDAVSQRCHGTPTIADLREATDTPAARGLPVDVVHLLAIVYADLTHRAFIRNGEPLGEGRIGSLQPQDELRVVPLPTAAEWERAKELASAVFGVVGDFYLNPGTVADLGAKLQRLVEDHVGHCQRLVDELRAALDRLGIIESLRLREAEAVVSVMQAMRHKRGTELLRALGGLVVPEGSSTVWLGVSLKQADAVATALRGANWLLFEGLPARVPTSPDTARIMRMLAEALSSSQKNRDLTQIVPELERQATVLVVGGSAQTIPPRADERAGASSTPLPLSPAPAVAPVQAAPRSRRVARGDVPALLDELRRDIESSPGTNWTITWTPDA